MVLPHARHTTCATWVFTAVSAATSPAAMRVSGMRTTAGTGPRRRPGPRSWENTGRPVTCVSTGGRRQVTDQPSYIALTRPGTTDRSI
jgi:hypothetical protein